MDSPTPITTSRYLRVEDLRRLRNVVFSSRRPVEGHYIGRHRSPQRGYSVEFNDYREYTPGDDVKTLDWKVFGRSDRKYVKLFEHESDMTVTLVVDASASMAYAGVLPGAGPGAEAEAKRGGSWLRVMGLAQRKRRGEVDTASRKHDRACQMAAAIAFLTVRQGDRAGFAWVADGQLQHLPPRGGNTHLRAILGAMERITPRGEARLAESLDALAQRPRTPRRGVLAVFSDLMEDRDTILKKLAVFRARGTDVIVFQVLHPDELHLPDLDDATFIDSESGGRVAMNVRDLRVAYERKLREFLAGWAEACKRAGYDYNLVSTATPYAKALERYLYARGRVG